MVVLVIEKDIDLLYYNTHIYILLFTNYIKNVIHINSFKQNGELLCMILI